jgi:hypothetical protein
VRGLDLLLRHDPSDLLHFADVRYGIHLLHVGGIDSGQPQLDEARGGKFGVVAGVGEQLRRSGTAMAIS